MVNDGFESWKRHVPLLSGTALKTVEEAVRKRRLQAAVFPRDEAVYRALDLTPLHQVKVVILGQDPYHGKGQADGLAFSVPEGVKCPPSLRNIFKEVARETGVQPGHVATDLARWARQGVLLLNTVLTVEEGKAASHSALGWQVITDAVIQAASDNGSNIAFLLWGNFAQSKRALINPERHLILEAPHPSPLSAHRGFIGCGHFTAANRFLASKGIKTIDW